MIRLLILPAAVLMQLCLGATYSWSVYVRPLRDLTGLGQGPVQLPFTVFYFVFPATMVFAGSFLRRWGPGRCALVGGLLFGGGWVTASLGKVHFAWTVLGIGGLAGVGAGLAYVVPIATCIRWFPRHKGLVTGVAVAGFGGGAALVSQAGGAWLAAGATPFGVFRAFGIAFLAVVAAASLAMRNPPGTRLGEEPRVEARGVWADPRFRLLYLAMFAGLAAGFTVNANLKELSPLGASALGVTAVALFAVGNAAGRIAWGVLFDRFGGPRTVPANLAAQAVLLVAAPWLGRTGAGFLGLAGFAGFCYGGVLVLYASSVAQIWGAEKVGPIYGWLFSANIPAALAPLGAGFLFDRTGSFGPALGALAVLLLAAAWAAARLPARAAASP